MQHPNSTRHVHADTSEVRPVSTPAQDRDISFRQAILLRDDLPADHPGRAKLEEIIDRNRPLVIAEEIHGTLERTAEEPCLAFMFFCVGAVCFTTGGALREFSLVATIILFLAGCVFIHLAYDKAGY